MLSRLRKMLSMGSLVIPRLVILGMFLPTAFAGGADPSPKDQREIPAELTDFESYPANPIFVGTDAGNWDARIRERGWILKEGGVYALWYTGYDGTRFGPKQLGLATSTDGIHWQRHSSNPLVPEVWVEDICVQKSGDTYYMFAEGIGDQAHLLTSRDWIHWKEQGTLSILRTDGQPIPPGPFGTPTVWLEHETWYLFYERSDLGVWLATSTDGRIWRNKSDDPVMLPGPESYDREMIAFNQIVKSGDRYFAMYHGSNVQTKPSLWTTCLAYSDDLLHWKKWEGNPLTPESANKSSGILVPEGNKYRLYTMHEQVQLHFPKSEIFKSATEKRE